MTSATIWLATHPWALGVGFALSVAVLAVLKLTEKAGRQ